MSPKQLASKECANSSEGICLGVMIQDDLSQFIDQDFYNKPCCVNDSRCDYFEKILIPQVRKSRTQDSKAKQEMAVLKYEINVMGDKRVKHCRNCEKPFHPGKPNELLCIDCKMIRRRKSWRRSQRKSRCQKSDPVS